MTDMKAGFDNIDEFPPILHIRKRDGELAEYNVEKIVHAAYMAMQSVNEGKGIDDARYIARSVQSSFQRAALLLGSNQEIIPGVEQLQDAVERVLMQEGYTKSAKHFILYRQKRQEARRQELLVSPQVRTLMTESKKLLRGPLSEFTYFRTYSRWIESERRRETWLETVKRYVDYMKSKLGNLLTQEEYDEIESAIRNMEVMPSMRLMWAAGEACDATNVAAFNCSFIAPTCIRDFGEILYILACGTGLGFAVESRNVQELPIVQYQTGLKEEVIKLVVRDSKTGWAEALVKAMEIWYMGGDVSIDYSLIRPEGARLKTMGGRASGPKPFVDLMNYVRSKILGHQGERLDNLTVHDIICQIGDCIVAGGVRRSALISLSDLKDISMRQAKTGHWHVDEKQRELANNSAVYNVRPSDEQFMKEWLSLIESHAGERGIFNRGSLLKQIPHRRRETWKEMGFVRGGVSDSKTDTGFWGTLTAQVGTNPCGEITLLSKQFCNLTEVMCRLSDNRMDLLRKVRIATVLGTYQSMLTNFPFLSKEWKENCERERLLGVSLTGQWDCIVVKDPEVLQALKEQALEVNAEFASRFHIPRSTSVTCGKPSGTVSLLVDSSSGGHQRYAEYYIRRVRISSSDPLFQMLKDQGVPYNPDNGFTHENATRWVFDFPVHSPQGPYVGEISALDQLEYWKKVKINFTEHNPSVTISVQPHEWYKVGQWILDNWDDVGGLSFLPLDMTVYKLAPHEKCTKEQYEALLAKFANVDYSKIVTYEREDNTEGSKEYACVGGVCELP